MQQEMSPTDEKAAQNAPSPVSQREAYQRGYDEGYAAGYKKGMTDTSGAIQLFIKNCKNL